MWKEVKTENFNDYEKCYTVDAWKTTDPLEEGKVIAKIYLNGIVVFLDEKAKADTCVQKAIANKLAILKV